MTVGTKGGGMLLSKRLSGILATASIMVELLQASLPTLSRVSRMLREGNMPKTWARQPGSLTTGLLSRSSCRSCLSDLRGVRSLTFSTLLAPSMRVCKCLDPARCTRCSPGMLLKTISSLMSAGRVGKFSRLMMPQSLRVSICRQRQRSSSCRTSAVKYPPNRTDTMSSTQTMWGGVPSVWSRMAVISLATSGLVGRTKGAGCEENISIIRLAIAGQIYLTFL